MGTEDGYISNIHSTIFGPINKKLPNGVKIGFGTVYLYKRSENHIVDKVASSKFTQAWVSVGVPVLFLLMVGSLLLLGYEAFQVAFIDPSPEPTPAHQPSNMVAIPGVNDFLPLGSLPVIAIALLVAAIAHEGAHAIAMRAERVRLEEYGIGLLFGIPIAAYVMPDEDEFTSLRAWGRMRVFSAGVFANTVITILTTLWFLLPVTPGLIDLFLVYFAPVFGGPFPDSELIAQIGMIPNFIFWSWFLNLNLGFINAMPVAILDGGRVISELGENTFSGTINIPNAGKKTLAITTVISLSIFSIAIFGPFVL